MHEQCCIGKKKSERFEAYPAPIRATSPARL